MKRKGNNCWATRLTPRCTPSFQGRGCPGGDPAPSGRRPGPRVSPPGARPRSSRNTPRKEGKGIKMPGESGLNLTETGDRHPHSLTHTLPSGNVSLPAAATPLAPGRGCPAAAESAGGGAQAAPPAAPGPPHPPAVPPRPEQLRVPGQTWLDPVSCGRLGWAAAGAPLLSLPAAQTQGRGTGGLSGAPELTSRPGSARRPAWPRTELPPNRLPTGPRHWPRSPLRKR